MHDSYTSSQTLEPSLLTMSSQISSSLSKTLGCISLSFSDRFSKVPHSSHSSSLPLFDTLPNEILLMIFSYAPNQQLGTHMLKYAYLSWVCQRWRDLLLNTPTFWSELNLNCKNHALLRTILHRSKNAPLSVSVGGPEYQVYDDASHQIVALENFVFPNMDRLYSLSLKLSYLRYDEIYAPLRRSAPALKHLQLSRATEEVIPSSPSYYYHQMEYYQSKDVDLYHLFDNACSLESLTFDMPQPFPWSTFEPMMSNIKELTLRTVTWDSKHQCSTHALLLTFLSQCPTIESLELRTTPDPSSSIGITLNPPKPNQIITLPRLSKLILGASQDVALLAHITTPNKLQELHLHIDRAIPNPLSLTNHILDLFDVSSLRSAVVVDGQILLAYSDVVRINSLLEPVVGTAGVLRLKHGTSSLVISSDSARIASVFIRPLLAAMNSLERLVASTSSDKTTNANNSTTTAITTTNTNTNTTLRHLRQFAVSDIVTLKNLKVILANQFAKRQFHS